MTRWKMRPAAIVLACAAVVIAFAGRLAPNDPAAQQRLLPYAPPMRIHFVDRAGTLHLHPFVCALAPTAAGTLAEDAAHPLPLRLFAGGHLLGVDPPARLLLFGTDALGRDLFARWLYGGRVSLGVAAIATLLCLLIAAVIGSAAGYCGGLIDSALMRLTEVAAALPWLYLLLAVRATLPLRSTPVQTLMIVGIVLTCIGWIRPGRLVRAVALERRASLQVESARSLGAGHVHVIARHVLPAARGVLMTQAAVLLPQFVLAEVALSFLGLGVAEPVPSWGNLLTDLQHPLVLATCWWMFLPALATVLVFAAIYSVADGAHQARLVTA